MQECHLYAKVQLQIDKIWHDGCNGHNCQVYWKWNLQARSTKRTQNH